MSFVSRITPERDYNATLSYAEKKGMEKGMEKGLEKGRQLEREIAEKEIAKLQADKLESARTLKKSGVALQVIASSLNLPLDVIEKL